MRKLIPRRFFTKEEKDRIIEAIREAEDKTSGEIRVYLERKGRGDLMRLAEKVFRKLGMAKTKKRNGVLVYFSLRDNRFAILGDQGIHDQVGDDFWKAVVSTMQNFFSRSEFAEGLIRGIRQIGEKLKAYFPREVGDVNELRDEIREENGQI